MIKSKLEECQSCGEQSAEYVEKKGHYRCTRPQCGAIWWDIFDKPSGINGYKCYNCNRRTLQSVDQIGNVNVRRCSTCGKTLLELIH
jgi:hypothetical protein